MISRLFHRFLYRNYCWMRRVRPWLARRFTRGGELVLGGCLLSAALGLDTNLAMAYQAFCFLALLLVVAALSSRLIRARFRVRRRLPRLAAVGVPLRYPVEIENLSSHSQRDWSWFEDTAQAGPSFDEFRAAREPGEERRPWLDRALGYYRWRWLQRRRTLATVKELPLPPLAPGGGGETLAELVPLRRGLIRFDTVTLGCREPLGLMRALIQMPAPGSLLVLPRRYPVPPIDLPGTMKYQPGGVALASSVGESEEFVSLREYRPGDPIRRIHWKSWAKTGKPIVKEFEEEFFVRHALILDTYTREPESERFEEAVSVAASFACALETQESLLDLLFVGTQAFCFTVGRGLAHTDQMLEILASVQPSVGQPFRLLQELVLEHVELVSGCIVVFLSWDAERQELVRRLCSLGVPLLVLVVVENGRSTSLDPGPLAGDPQSFRVLETGRIAEDLARFA